ncbi:MAG: hypothetical protein EBS50_12020 [Sphingomonadaceae bacterium]|nr:hypothetical protein [Sphingomonadaceae bacterium]
MKGNVMQAIDKLRALLSLPDAQTRDDLGCFSESGDLPIYFDPWELFPALYGGYSSEFDDMAITVLENIAAEKSERESLAHQMFREMLCTADLCVYGTSPRCCFPNYETDFGKLLPALIERWQAYFAVKWGVPYRM